MEEELLSNDSLFHMNMLSICTKSEQKWLQCVDQLNDLSTTNYVRLSGFDGSVRLFHTPFNYGLLDIQIPFTINSENHMNDMLNERYVLSNSSDAIAMSDVNSSVETRKRNVHHPKYFNVTEALHVIEVGLSDDAMPVNGGSIIVVQLPTSACSPTKPPESLDLIVIVKSCIYCFDKRSYARDTYMKSHLWKDFRIRFVFVVGLPTPNETDVYHFDGVTVNLGRNAFGLSKLYKNSRWIAAKKLYDESRKFNDMLVGSFHDTYFNLTSKMMLSYRWTTTFCKGQTPLYLFVDDDYVLLPGNTIRLVRSLNASVLRSTVGGLVHYTSVVARPSKEKFDLRWAVSVNEYPWDYYPPYFYGIGYLLGSNIVSDASVAIAFTQSLRIDDSFLGIVLSRLNRTLTNMKELSMDASTPKTKSFLVIIDIDTADDIINWKTGDIMNH
ncbi:unnamed protein product [Schistosoma rodhaini]|uniref:Hexosyltransferase n=1 Tax=Schistosoma mansoni TaxID=6183 RepID=A0A3Q0KPW7_SCHMA|nr:putative beta-1,3-galactosyltransferase brn [Schistosoma mansoni]CAH8676935.1 unnamed protein product [Schistosoma rodhaini]|eukprot:XP_018655154.1 putative beta-1,3-galactosyltransferase brn [Schistosoma mansoni]